ncbi:MAG: SDR family NAD(P)-dependent oxidoreductase [Desulfuromonadaceae bacterium]|nr:SDR family NAD(P)-dependent oxidoreductase [Desulfuromonadaceae bacterium]MDD2848353.1 SDR family NAD(P)-dependent oxidoreductase [Desulfuromonadaceae bacterium]MDD4129251.1 SDR family NAD(P)-dependent oxidoreductase [Desulfuromonadaceae bacterium]
MIKDTTNKTTSAGTSSLAIIGIGCLFPRAKDSDTYWANIREGIDAITDIPASHWRVEDYHSQDPKSPDMTYGRRGGFLSDVPFNPMEYNIPPTTMEAIDTSQLLGLVATGNALKDAGYGADRQYDRDRVSVILGVTGTLELVIPLAARLGHPHWKAALKDAGVDDTTAADVVQRISDSYVSWQENSFPGLLGNVVAGRISKQFDLGGTNCVVDAACASSLSALHLAAMELETGKSDMVVTGGIDTFNDIFMYMCFSKTPALSPSGDIKPFDASGDGTILGEGLGIMVVKRLADAERDGDRIYAVIRGVGSSSDGKGEAIYTPSASGQKKAIKNAYERAGVTPASIGLVEAHGTGTKVGDAVEVSALRNIYGEADKPWCALGSVKSQIGHTKAAAGAAGMIKAALALHHKVIPPTIKVQQPLREVSEGQTPFYLTDRKRPWLSRNGQPRRAAVSALGFGGSNFHVVLEEYQPVATTVDWDGSVQLLPFSAPSAPALEKALDAVAEKQDWDEIRSLAADLRRAFDATAPCRLALIVECDKTPLKSLCNNALTMLRKNPDISWSTPDGACFATGAAPGKIGILFPGQGAQYTGMLRDLACSFPQMLASLDSAERGFVASTGNSLSDLIYPPSAFSDTAREVQEASLRATDVAQPAIGAVSLGALRVLESFGLTPDATAGHSYGELTALCAAGRLDESSFHALSRLRGQLMAAGDGDRGTMLAVSAPLAEVQQLIDDEKFDLVIANRNAPNQAVLSGSSSEINRAAGACVSRKLSCKRLTVAAAFHSPLVADAAAPLLSALADITISAGSVPVYANSTAACYPADAGKAKKILAGQLAQPVEFVAEIEALYAAGIRTFVEIGPGARLSGLVAAILAGRPYTVTALDASAGKRSGIVDLARCLALLAVTGHNVKLDGWDEGYVATPPATGKKPLLTINLNGANYVKPKAKRPPVTPRPASGAAVPGSSQLFHQPAATTKPSELSRDILSESLRVTREGMTALTRIQEETAQLHRRFLEGQDAAGKTIQLLLEQQQQILHGGSGSTLSPAAFSPTVAVHAAPSLSVSVPRSVLPPVVATPAPVVQQQSDRVAETLLAVVSEKTGYPVEMLEMEMGLDSDLGIDSIKRVEILSALQERLPGSPVIGPEHLGTLHTLGEIARHLGAGASPAPASVIASSGAAAVDLSNITEALLSVVSEKTGYPVEMLEMEMGLDSDLGIDSIKRVEILSALQERLPGSPVIGPEHLGTLHTLGEIARYLGAGASPAPASVVASSGVAAVDLSNITETLLAVVSEKTGYPVEMLEMEMGLDSDLGIDSIKRVEILSALQERLPGSPVIGPEHLGTLHTLGEIARHLGAAAAPASVGASTSNGAGASLSNITEALLSVVSEKTGYPVEMLEMEMGLDSDLGIDSIKRVEILSALQERLPGSPVIGPEHLGTLHTLGEIARHLGAAAAPCAAETCTQAEPVSTATTASETVAALPVNRSTITPVPLTAATQPLSLAHKGAIWITDDGSAFSAELYSLITASGRAAQIVSLEDAFMNAPQADLAGLVICAPSGGVTDDLFYESAFLLLKSSAQRLRQSGKNGGALLATISRLDGSFGTGNETVLADPLSGGLAGMVKTASHEWSEISCKAIDLGLFPDAASEARAVADELFLSGPLEVGLTPAGRIGLEIKDLPARAPASAAPLQPGDVVVITGGGRGVTAATAVALAEAYQPLLVLVGRSAELQPEPEWLSVLNDESQIKRAILEHASEKLHPREIESRYQSIVAGRELRTTMAKISLAGGQSVYRSVDIRDAAAVSDLLDEIRRNYGPVKGIVHGAGVLADRLIGDKTLEQFSLVYSTKVAGLRSLLEATAADDLRTIVLFSSTTGRFGRSGQVDYAVANEILNKMAQAESRRRSACRTVSINWGPWDGGMVTPALKKVFAGEGIGLIGLKEGGELLVREIAANGEPVEIIALAGATAGSLTGVAAQPDRKLCEAFNLTLTVEEYPFIRSHVIDGKAVLPMAMAVEWLAHGAMHGNPGFRFHGFNNLRICKGVIFDQGASCTLHVMAGRAEKSNSLYTVPVELVGSNDRGSVLHVSADILLATKLPEGTGSITELPVTAYNGSIYNSERLFHGADLQGIEQVDSCSPQGIAARAKAAPKPENWINQPLRNTWLTDPLVIDCAFQLMILWSFERSGSASLPTFAGSYRQFQESFPREGARIVIKITAERTHGASADIEFIDRNSGKLIARLENYECIIDPSLQKAFLRNTLEPVVA